jgi:DNA-binding beta-propeller fold protein YncE
LTKTWVCSAAGWLAAATFLSGAAGVSPAIGGEQVMQVPGHADFIAVDGTAIWVTNAGRVERWSRDGKSAEVAMSHPCGAMAILAGSLWVADCKDRTLNRIDLKTAKRVAAIPTGIGSPNGELNVVAGAGSIWVTSDVKGVIARVDPASNLVVASVQVAPLTTYMAFGFGSLWAVSLPSQVIQKIDPVTNTVVKKTDLGREPGFLAAGEGGVWVQEQGDGTVARIDPATGEVSGRVKVDDTLKYGDIDTGGGRVWLRTTDKQTIVVIDARTMTILARMGKDVGSGALRYTPAGVWTTAHDHQTLSWWDLAADTSSPSP